MEASGNVSGPSSPTPLPRSKQQRNPAVQRHCLAMSGAVPLFSRTVALGLHGPTGQEIPSALASG